MYFFSDNIDTSFEINSLEHAYYALVKDDLTTAEKIFKSMDSPRALWGECLIQILKGYITLFPTYFQIRNFLEIDLDYFIKNEKIEYVESILGALEVLSNINHETYKYVARVMIENKLYKSAFTYLEKSKNIFYKDPEIHFLYAKFYIQVRDFYSAKYYLNECLRFIPDYYPAKMLLEELNSNLD